MGTLIFICAVALGQSDATPSGDEEAAAQVERWRKYYRSVAGEYAMESGSDPRTTLTLQPEPVFHWSNPAGGARSHGSMFVWTHEGRPEVVGTIWSREPDPTAGKRFTVHSLHSLSQEPITATRRNSVFWSPQSPGVEPIAIADAPEPSPSPQRRLTQMRNIVRELGALTMPPNERERRLEIRPQPVYRFENPTIERDGAVFIWLDESDPELVTLVETRTTAAGARWHMSFARFAGTPVMARYKDREIWSFAENAAESRRGGPGSRYISVHGIDVLPSRFDE